MQRCNNSLNWATFRPENWRERAASPPLRKKLWHLLCVSRTNSYFCVQTAHQKKGNRFILKQKMTCSTLIRQTPSALHRTLSLVVLFLAMAVLPLRALEKRDGIYLIRSADDLAAFARLVNEGEVGASGQLLSDIDFSGRDEMIGRGEGLAAAVNPFRGTFDGRGHTVTVGYHTSQPFTALFRFVDGASILNLHVAGTVQSSAGHAAGVAGHVTGRSRFANILSSVKLVSAMNGFVGNGGVAGFILAGSATFDNCGFNGSIHSETGSEFGGIVGWMDIVDTRASASLTNCYVMADFHGGVANSSTFAVGDPSLIALDNCYYLHPIGKEQGTPMTARQFADGTVCWLLNRNQLRHPVWFQTLGSDAAPVPFAEGHGRVYVRKLDCLGHPAPGEQPSNNPDGASFDIPAHSYDGYVCSVCRALNPNFCNETDGYYEIGDADQLSWFAYMVNSGHPDINGRLMADIDFSRHAEMIGLGVGRIPNPGFRGVFDGQGHDIRLGYETKEPVAALFRYINGARIKNLSTSGTLVAHAPLAAGVAGSGSGTLSNVISTVTLRSTVRGKGLHGGLMAALTTGNAFFTNCAFAGSFIGPETTHYGGFVGQPGGFSITFTNCFVDVRENTFLNTGASFTPVFNADNYKFHNCYYTGNSFGISQGTQLGREQMANGELLRRLSSDKESTWTQTPGRDAFPLPFRVQELRLTDNTCQITSAEDLEQFARLVASGHSDINAVLTTDIDYRGRRELIGSEAHHYSGTFDGAGHKISVNIDEERPALGLFRYVDRGGTLKNLHVDGIVSAHDQYAGGIVGWLADGTVSNCLATVEIKSDYMGDCSCGGICGTTSRRATIANCQFVGQINASGGEGFAGLVGWVDGPGTVIRNSLVVCDSYLGFDDRSDAIVRARNARHVTLENVYYLNNIEASIDGAHKITMEQISNGEVFYTLLGNAIRQAEQTIDSQQVKIRKKNFTIALVAFGASFLGLVLLALTFYFRSRTLRLRHLYEQTLHQHAQWLEQLRQQAAAPAGKPQPSADDSENLLSELYARLLQTMEEKKLYVRPGLDETTLAREVGTNVNYLSRCINQMAGGKNFSRWLNTYRVNHAIQLIEEDNQTNIAVLSEMSGFSSQKTFTRHFKDVTGMTATQYILSRR